MSRQDQRSYQLFISTGEVSGDLQGALLVKALRQQANHLDIELKILGLGGEMMAAAGVHCLADTSAIGSIGLFETLPYLRSMQTIQQQVRRYLRQQPPDLVVMIDYFAPNVSLGQFMRRYLPDVPLVYYIAPQEWVWSVSQRNTRQILNITDQLLAIFPAEATYYREHGGNVTWVGHPLVDRMQTAPDRATARASLGIGAEQLAVALIPVSRQQELRYILPVIFTAAQQIQAKLPQVQFWIPLSLERYRQPIEAAIQQYGLQARLVTGQSEVVIAAADLVIAKSGTVNLETALLEVPQVVMYRVNPLTAWVAKHLLHFSAPFVSPPNLVMMQPIVPEFLQDQATPAAISEAVLELLQNPAKRAQMQRSYVQMRQKLGEPGVCNRAAAAIFHMLHISQSQQQSAL
jgi:lipid-A-disaccharide synthase